VSKVCDVAGEGVPDWQPVCRIAELEIGRGVAALVHGQGVAIFRVDDQHVYAVANHDPYARHSMLARGIVGCRDGAWFVGSPVHGHAFDLITGICLEDAHVAVAAFEVQVIEGVVMVGHRKHAA
jgi:nitrite reductase (NADH) small subunit